MLLIAPGTWLRKEMLRDDSVAMNFVAMDVELPTSIDVPGGRLERQAVWDVQSPNTRFGGFSSLFALDDGRMQAFSDVGTMITFTAPGEGPVDPQFDEVRVRARFASDFYDVESATRDPRTGRYWLGVEYLNLIGRYSADGHVQAMGRPQALRQLPANEGPEAMVRLADGRFVILPEDDSPGILYPRDPLRPGTAAAPFDFSAPGGYHPTDIGMLPDGRMLVLMRRIDLHWLPFSAQLVVVEPADIAAGAEVRGEVFARLDDLLPRENYEGVAVQAGSGGSATIWIISDDNRGPSQRTLLARLHYRPQA